MSQLAFIVQTDAKELNYETQSYVRSHVMVDYMRRKHLQQQQQQERQRRKQSGATDDPAAGEGDDNAASVDTWKPSNGGSFAVLKICQKKRKTTARRRQAASSPSPSDGTTLHPTSPNGRKRPSPFRSPAKPLRPKPAVPAACQQDEESGVVDLPPVKGSVADMTRFTGNLKIDALSRSTFTKIMEGLSFYIHSHAITSSSLTLGAPAIISSYFYRHVLSSEAAFFAAAPKMLFFNAIERGFTGDLWIPRKDLYYLKSKALRLINEEIKLSKGRLMDSTFCATICLEMFESASGSSSARIHLQGLHRMVTSSDPNAMSEHAHYTHALIIEDLLNAIARDRPPCLLALPRPRPRAPRPTRPSHTDPDPPPFWRASPLRWVDDDNLPPDIPPRLTRLIADVFRLFELRVSGAAHPPQAQAHAEIATILDRLRTYPLAHPSAHASPDAAVSDPIATTIHLAATLHVRALAHGVRWEHASNAPVFAALCAAVRRTSFSAWMGRRLGMVYVWVLLTGLAAAAAGGSGESGGEGGEVGEAAAAEVARSPYLTAEQGVMRDVGGEDSLPAAIRGLWYRKVCQFWLAVGLRWWDAAGVGETLGNFCWVQGLLRGEGVVEGLGGGLGL